jgi:hypothetical protein
MTTNLPLILQICPAKKSDNAQSNLMWACMSVSKHHFTITEVQGVPRKTGPTDWLILRKTRLVELCKLSFIDKVVLIATTRQRNIHYGARTRSRFSQICILTSKCGRFYVGHPVQTKT